jgi:hypothetical protein
MKKIFAAAGMAVLMCGLSSAAIIPTLVSIDDNGDGTFRYSYDLALAADHRLGAPNPNNVDEVVVIYDFGGYVDGSIFGDANWTTETALSGPAVPPRVGVPPTDNPAITNLVFRWVGGAVVGPQPTTPGDPGFALVWADSTFNLSKLGEYQGQGIKVTLGADNNTAGLTAGNVEVPTDSGDVIPEPGTMGLLGLGFAGLAFKLRSRKNG